MADEVPDVSPVPAGLRVCLRTSNGAWKLEKKKRMERRPVEKPDLYTCILHFLFYRSIIDVDKCGIYIYTVLYCLFCFWF